MPKPRDLDDLRSLIRRLRAEDGCPWDREQTLDSVRAYLIEEAHEAAQAIDSDDPEDLRDELGDLLFQAAFVGVLAEERGDFELADAIGSVHRKMVDRHPHVFGASEHAEDRNLGHQSLDADEVARRWERRKAAAGRRESILDGVPASLPALVMAYRLGQKAAGVGFDWPDLTPVRDKVREELAEVEAELAAAESSKGSPERLRDELGDLLFAVVNLSRHLGVDPESALSRTNGKFRRRFRQVEQELKRRGVAPGTSDLGEMDAIWERVKRSEKDGELSG